MGTTELTKTKASRANPGLSIVSLTHTGHQAGKQ